MNTSKVATASSGSAQDAVLMFGSEAGPKALTEQWNGTAWTEVADLATGRDALAGSGNSVTTALAYGGAPGGITTTEEWTVPESVTNLVMSD
jgi:hypothetical protein